MTIAYPGHKLWPILTSGDASHCIHCDEPDGMRYNHNFVDKNRTEYRVLKCVVCDGIQCVED